MQAPTQAQIVETLSSFGNVESLSFAEKIAWLLAFGQVTFPRVQHAEEVPAGSLIFGKDFTLRDASEDLEEWLEANPYAYVYSVPN